MFKKIWPQLITIILLFSISNVTYADIVVGVKKGDWIEYTVNYTGSPLFGHDIDWARIDVTDVQGKNISISITSRFPDGRTEVFNSTLNLETGYLIDNYVIPANLGTGDTFYANNFGNVIIEHEEERTYAGASRTVLYASTANNTYVWDQESGVTVEGKTKESNFTIHSIVSKTNIWETSFQSISLIDAFLITAFAVIIIVALIVRSRRKDR